MTDSARRVILLPSGRQGDVPDGTTVLDAAHQLGVDLEALCGGRQRCAKCLVGVEQGTFPKHGITSGSEHLTPPSADERRYAAAHGIDLHEQRMACAARIAGDVLISVPETSLARKQVFRKAAGDVPITLNPAVRMVYVEVEPAALGSRGDWQRLQVALADQRDLHDLSIDLAALRSLQAALRAGSWGVTVTIWREREVIRVEPGYVESLYGLAVDIGSTTVAGYLCDLLTGEIVATEALMNPQVRFGEDIMSRISYAAEPGGVGRLHHAIVKALNDLMAGVAASAGIAASAITDLVVVGNSVMTHLFLELDPHELGTMPFALSSDDAHNLKARDLGLKAAHPGARVHLLPSIAAYVGADTVGVLLAAVAATPDNEITLIVDIGTNAEIVLASRDFLLASSSPTGPAFEGAQITHGQRAAAGAIERFRYDGQRVRYKVVGDPRWSDELPPGETLAPTGICGSGIIEIVAELNRAGVIRTSGRFPPSDSHAHVRANGKSGEFVVAPADETASGSDIVVTQHDVRAIQLAKAALFAGIRLLMEQKGIDHIDRIKLAGAFGSYIDPLYAMRIGLIPECDLEHVEIVGNAAGDGARIALVDADQREAAQMLARRVEYVETAAHSRFQDCFVEALALPEIHLTTETAEGTEKRQF
ncbi:MAG: DUF4445 domain-containing protein [Anaerolineae bacterium]|nr:DUF4445 domain-containing protein [Anaerolineae bacterium]